MLRAAAFSLQSEVATNHQLRGIVLTLCRGEGPCSDRNIQISPQIKFEINTLKIRHCFYTCQMLFSLLADNPLQEVWPKVCQESGGQEIKLWLEMKTSMSGEEEVRYLTLVVNCTPVLMMRGFCGCVGMQGCFSTTKELQTNQMVPHLQGEY